MKAVEADVTIRLIFTNVSIHLHVMRISCGAVK